MPRRRWQSRARGRRGPSRGSSGRGRWTPSRSSGPRRCASPTAGLARAVAPRCWARSYAEFYVQRRFLGSHRGVLILEPLGASISTVTSPFIYEEPVDPADLVDRENETKLLVDRALDARNSRLEGPRRFGKTSLLRAVLAEADRGGAIPIEVNFLGCVTPADVAQRIERAYSAQLDGSLRRWFDGVVRTFQPTVSAAPGGVGVKAHPRGAQPGLLDRLRPPRRVPERAGRDGSGAARERSA